MNIENVPLRCRTCPNLLPYIRDVQYPESMQITDEMRKRLIAEYGFSEEVVDRADAENRFDLEESRRTLDEAIFRTVGCAGVKIVVVDPSMQSSEGQRLDCQSYFWRTNANDY